MVRGCRASEWASRLTNSKDVEEYDSEPTAMLESLNESPDFYDDEDDDEPPTEPPPEAAEPPQAEPSEDAPPKEPLTEPAPTPEPAWWDDDDEDDDELSFQAPFDMATHLLQREPPVAEGPLEPYCAVHVVRVVAGRVLDSVGVLPGTPFTALDGELSCAITGASAELSVSESVQGEVHKGGERFDVSTLPLARGRRSLTLDAGDSTVLTGTEGTWRVDAYRPRLAPRRGGFEFGPGSIVILLVALVLHGTVALAVAVVAPRISLDEEQAAEEVFAVLELEQPPEPPPAQAPVKAAPTDATHMAERPPDVSVQAIQEIRERPKTTDVDSLLAVLSKGSGTPGQSEDLKDLVSNLDAVAPPAGSAGGGFDIAGAIGRLPGGEVNIARSGGGGAISTLSSEEVSDKTLTDLGKARKGAVRGKVTRMASAAKVRGSLSREQISRVVNENIHEIQGCYERRLMSDNTLGGRIVFDWTVTAQGSVSQVRVRSSTVSDSKVADCISGLIKAWRFEKPAGGEVIVTFPFLFRSVAQ